MKLAIVRRRFASAGGAERFIENTMAALSGSGVEVTLVAEAGDGLPADSDRFLRLPSAKGSRTRRYQAFQTAVSEAVRRSSFNLVQSHERLVDADLFRAGDGVHAAWVERLKRERAWWRRPLLDADPFHRHLMMTERRMARETDMIFVANSAMVARELKDWLDLPDARIRVIENGVDLDIFRPPTAEERDSARAGFGLMPDDRVVGFVGSGFERKGAFALVEALAMPELDGVKALIAGRDKRSSGLARRIEQLGLGGDVKMLGAVSGVAGLLHACDAFALPTLYDPMPNAALEAIACGLPIVTTPDAGIGEVAVRHGAGRMCSRRTDDLAAAIAETFLHLETGRKAAAGLRGRFDLTRTTAQWLNLYSEMTGGPRHDQR